jgi:HTH-type transcriptional regulator / antitoxin HipB
MTMKAKITSQKSLGRVIAQARLLAGLTQRELADKLGTSQRYIWELESGKDSTLLERLLGALEATGATMTIEIPDDGRPTQ